HATAPPETYTLSLHDALPILSPRHMPRFSHPLSGWWGHAAPFAMQADFRPCPTIRSALCGTQPTVSLALVECGLDLFAQTDMARSEEHTSELQSRENLVCRLL